MLQTRVTVIVYVNTLTQLKFSNGVTVILVWLTRLGVCVVSIMFTEAVLVCFFYVLQTRFGVSYCEFANSANMCQCQIFFIFFW